MPTTNGHGSDKSPWLTTWIGPYCVQGAADGIAAVQLAHLTGDMPRGNPYLKVTHPLFPGLKVYGGPLGVASLLTLDPARLNPNKGTLELVYKTQTTDRTTGNTVPVERKVTNTPYGVATLMLGMGLTRARPQVHIGECSIQYEPETKRVVMADRQTLEVLWTCSSAKPLSKKAKDRLALKVLIEAGLPDEVLVSLFGSKFKAILEPENTDTLEFETTLEEPTEASEEVSE